MNDHRTIKGMFQFDKSIAEVFDDMAVRSIPGYLTTQQLCSALARNYLKSHSRIYDIGSATGTTLLILNQALLFRDVKIIGIEPSPAMNVIAHRRIREAKAEGRIEIIQQLAHHAAYQNAAMVIFNYTLHFIPPAERVALLTNIYEEMLPDGILILAEKIIPEDRREWEQLREQYLRFKNLNGYTWAEILAKEEALVGVLTPLTLNANIENLRSAGFRSVEVAFEAPPFATLIAWKKELSPFERLPKG